MKQVWQYSKRSGIVLLGLIVGLAACTSNPIRFHTLVPPPGQTTSDKAAIHQDRIIVENVTVPPQVNRTELVVREDASGLVILESHWWGASLPEEIQSALTARLDGPSGNNPVRTWVTITRFDTVPGRGAWLDADYRLSARQSTDDAVNCRFHSQTEANEGITSLILAHQTNLDALARQIAETARDLEQGTAACP